MNEDAGQTSGATVEILVRTPRRKVHLVFVELQVDVAGRVGQVPAGQSTDVVQSFVIRAMGCTCPVRKFTPAIMPCQRRPRWLPRALQAP